MDTNIDDNASITQSDDVIGHTITVTSQPYPRLLTAKDISNWSRNGTYRGPVAEEVVSMLPEIDIMKLDYDDLHGYNLSTTDWYNYTCRSLELPNGFFKDVLEPTICVSGIIGIIITMIVLSRKTMVTSTNCYLTALAVADLLFLLLMSSKTVMDKIDDCKFQLSDEKTIASHFIIIFMDIFSTTTIGVTVMLAVERYIAICQPMEAMTICSVKRARVIIVIIFIVAVILCTPRFFDMEIDYLQTKSGQTILMVTWVYPYNEQVYTYLVQGFTVTVLPLFCLLALNIRLIIEIRRSTRYLQVCLGADWQMRSVVSQEEFKITMMLICVVVAFFVCQAPFMVYNLIMAFFNYDLQEHRVLTNSQQLKVFKQVVTCLVALKSSCNFILYCWFSEKFWTTFKRLFCLRHCLSRQGVHQPNGCSNNNSHNNSHHNPHRPSCYITRETIC